jgi:hypothetical protein
MTNKNAENLEEIAKDYYKPSKFVRVISWSLAKFPLKKQSNKYDQYLDDLIHLGLRKRDINFLHNVPIPPDLEKRYDINKNNRNKKAKNLALTSACSTTGYMKTLVGIIIRANVGTLPARVVKKSTVYMEEKYGIKESARSYTNFSLFGIAIGSSIGLAISQHLINPPDLSLTNWLFEKIDFLKSALHLYGKIRLGLALYSLFLETPFRTLYSSVKKEPIGIPLFEAWDRYLKPHLYDPFIKPKIYDPYIGKGIAKPMNGFIDYLKGSLKK